MLKNGNRGAQSFARHLFGRMPTRPPCAGRASAMADACPCTSLDVGSTKALVELHSEPSTHPHLPSSASLFLLASAHATVAVAAIAGRVELNGHQPIRFSMPSLSNPSTVAPSPPFATLDVPFLWPLPPLSTAASGAARTPPPASMASRPWATSAHAACVYERSSQPRSRSALQPPSSAVASLPERHHCRSSAPACHRARGQEAMGHLTPSRDHLWMRLDATTLTGRPSRTTASPGSRCRRLKTGRLLSLSLSVCLTFGTSRTMGPAWQFK
jgi:hypothetical protein